MKFLESTNFFVRTVVFDFINKDEKVKLKFKLFPMVHIGTKKYYETVLENLTGCDEILYEGIRLKQSKVITKQYKKIAQKLELVTQREHLRLGDLDAKLVHTDLNEKTGKEAWRALRFKEKFNWLFVKRWRLFLGFKIVTREVLAKQFMTAAEEHDLAYGPRRDEQGTMENLIMNEREQIIFKTIRKKMKEAAAVDKVIGIVYGAKHMKVIARNLIDEHHYVPRSGKFIKVFTLA